MKKTISMLLVFATLFALLTFSAHGEDALTPISVHLRSDLAGATFEEIDRFFELESGDIVPREESPILVSDYVGNLCLTGDILKPGRTYTVYYIFQPADGVLLPPTLNPEDITIHADKGYFVYWYGITEGAKVDGVHKRFVEIHATVTVQGNFFQMLWGRIEDTIRKIFAWSPY